MLANKLLRSLSIASVLPKGFAVTSGMTYVLANQLGKLHFITGSIRKDWEYLQIDTMFITRKFEEVLNEEIGDGTRWYDAKIEYDSETYYLIHIF